MRKRTLLILTGVLVALVSATLVAQPVTKVYLTSGGNKIVVASGGTMDVESGGLFQIAGTSVTASAAELNALASTGLSASELGFLNGVVAGTVAASKVIVVDSNLDAASARNFSATNLKAGKDAVAGTVTIFPATTASGKAVWDVTNQTGDTQVTHRTAAMGQATVITTPDPGTTTASVVLTEGAATINGVKTFDNNGIAIEDSDATHTVTITPGNETASRVLSVPVLGGADTIVTTGTAQTISGVKTFSAAIVNTAGAGAVAGGGVTLVENGDGAFHKTVFTLTATEVTVTDTAGVNGAQGNLKIYDFPEGVIVQGGCVANVTTLAGAGGIADGAEVVLALGSVAAGVGDATLTSTEADFVASFAGTLVAGAGAFTKYGEPSVTSFDGHTTAVDLIFNVAVPDADVSANDTLAVDGTITCTWWNNGDWT